MFQYSWSIMQYKFDKDHLVVKEYTGKEIIQEGELKTAKKINIFSHQTASTSSLVANKI